jgi:hypothetical protein
MEIDRVGSMTLSCEHSHGMVENVASTLDTLVEPTGSMALFVNWDRERLSSAVIDRIDKCNVELVRVFSKVMGT